MIQDIRQIKQTDGCSGNFEIATCTRTANTWHTQSRLVYANTYNLYVHLHNPVQTVAAVGTAQALPWWRSTCETSAVAPGAGAWCSARLSAPSASSPCYPQHRRLASSLKIQETTSADCGRHYHRHHRVSRALPTKCKIEVIRWCFTHHFINYEDNKN